MNLTEFTGKDLSEFAENFGWFPSMTRQIHAIRQVKCNLLLQYSKTKYLVKAGQADRDKVRYIRGGVG